MDYSNGNIEELKNRIGLSKGITREPTRTNTMEIPYSFIRSSDLSSMEKIMYLYLCTYEGCECPSIRKMAEELGTSSKTIDNAIKNLESKKLVCRITRIIVGKNGQKEKGTNLYHLAGLDKITGTLVELDLELIQQAYPEFKEYLNT